MIKEKTAKYPFIIANTQHSSKDDKHWWSILDIEPKKMLFFFESFVADGVKNCIITDNKKKTVQKIVSGIAKMTRTDNKIMLGKIKFQRKFVKTYQKRKWQI